MNNGEPYFDPDYEDGSLVGQGLVGQMPLAAFLTPAFCLAIYLGYLLYRCCCSRNYAEWRRSWCVFINKVRERTKGKKSSYPDDPSMYDGVSVKYRGHQEEIYAISSCRESSFVASTCLSGDIIVWDALSGVCHTHVRRGTVGRRSPSTSTPTFSSSFSSSSELSNPDQQTVQPTTLNLRRPPSHRRHHSLSSVSSLQSTSNHSRQASTSTSRPYDFGPFARKITSSRELLTEIVRSAMTAPSPTTSGIIETNGTSIAKCVVDSPLTFKSLWAMEVFGRYVYVGCENGRIEVWDGMNGNLAFMQDKQGSTGITGIKVTNTRLVVSFLDGVIETYHLEPRNGCTPLSPKNSQLYYSLFNVCRAHRQPVTCLELSVGYILSGSLDHTIKVHSLEDRSCIYTLHGHYGAITCLEVDPHCPTTAMSGCQTGQVCIWDLQTGTCLFSLEAHFGTSVSAIIPTPHYVITSGTDDIILVWDKTGGHLVHTINKRHSPSRQVLSLLTANILVTARDDDLVLYDISDGRVVSVVGVNGRDNSSGIGRHPNPPIRNLRVSSQARVVICDSGSDLCVVHFPGVTEKDD